MRTMKVEVWDDLNHEIPADQTRTIGKDGIWYEADLSDEHAKELDEALARFIEHARRIGGRAQSTKIRDTAPPVLPAAADGGHVRPSNSLGAARARNGRIRKWATEQPDITLPPSFPKFLPRWITERYNEAHPEDRDLALAET